MGFRGEGRGSQSDRGYDDSAALRAAGGVGVRGSPHRFDLNISPAIRTPVLHPDGDRIIIMPLVAFQDKNAVGLRWNRNRMEPDGRTFDLSDTLIAATKIYEQPYIMDMRGLTGNRPQLEIVKEICRVYEAWVDVGLRYAEDAIDVVVVNAEQVVVSLRSIAHVDELEETRMLSDRMVPCIDIAGDELVTHLKTSDTPEEALRFVADTGFEKVVILDNALVYAREGFAGTHNEKLVDKAVALDLEVYYGGGLRDSDTARLEKQGAAGALLYMTDILGKLPRKKHEGPEPETVRVEAGAPAPHAVPT